MGDVIDFLKSDWSLKHKIILFIPFILLKYIIVPVLSLIDYIDDREDYIFDKKRHEQYWVRRERIEEKGINYCNSKGRFDNRLFGEKVWDEVKIYFLVFAIVVLMASAGWAVNKGVNLVLGS